MNRLHLCLIFVVCLCLATLLEPRFQSLRKANSRSSSVFAVLMGDSRQMFANHFFAKADAYFHNGRYPTIFDRVNSTAPSHMTAQGQKEHDHEGEDEKEAGSDFMGPPKDWIEAFGRRFTFTGHAHLEGHGNEREILPWLRISADLDPHRVETYVTAAYWLRKRLNQPLEAEQFLREGLRANPDSSELLLELGHIYDENKNDRQTARNLWKMALQKWIRNEGSSKEPDEVTHMEILGCLVRLEEREGNWAALLPYLQELKKVSPRPDDIEKQIQEAKVKISAVP